MFPVSEICLRFPKYVYGFRFICDVSRCRGSSGGPRRLRRDPQPPGASCHALVTAPGAHIVVSRAVSKTRGSRKVGATHLSFSILPLLITI
jgi:hypothetical protein